MSDLIKLVSKDSKIAKVEGVIERFSIDAKELISSGNYKLLEGKSIPVKDKEDKVKETPEDPIEKLKVEIDSMNTAALNEFVDSKNITVDFSECKNLKDKRVVVFEAMTAETETETETEEL